MCLPEQQYETPLLPSGCIFKLVFVSTWGDNFYVGLNGLELLSERDETVRGNNPKGPTRSSNAARADTPARVAVCWRQIALEEGMVHAEPRDIRSLPEVDADDPRTLDKLCGRAALPQTARNCGGTNTKGGWAWRVRGSVDGNNDTYDDAHMWLAPLSQGSAPNTLYICFNELVSLSVLRVWNYAKTPQRGVREVEVCVGPGRAALFGGGGCPRQPCTHTLPAYSRCMWTMC